MEIAKKGFTLALYPFMLNSRLEIQMPNVSYSGVTLFSPTCSRALLQKQHSKIGKSKSFPRWYFHKS